MKRNDPSTSETPESTEGKQVEVDRSKLLGFDQSEEDYEAGRLGAHLSAKIGDKPGRK